MSHPPTHSPTHPPTLPPARPKAETFSHPPTPKMSYPHGGGGGDTLVWSGLAVLAPSVQQSACSGHWPHVQSGTPTHPYTGWTPTYPEFLKTSPPRPPNALRKTLVPCWWRLSRSSHPSKLCSSQSTNGEGRKCNQPAQQTQPFGAQHGTRSSWSMGLCRRSGGYQHGAWGNCGSPSTLGASSLRTCIAPVKVGSPTAVGLA